MHFRYNALQFPCSSEPCRCFATPRLAKALQFHRLTKQIHCVGFPCPCAARTGSAIPEHHNADAICCFSYAVYFQAFALLCLTKATPDRSIGVQSPYDDSTCKAVTMLFSAIALPHYDLHCRCDIRRGRGMPSNVRRYGGLPQSRRLAAATAPSEREPGIRGSGNRWGWRRLQNGGKRCPGECRFGWC